MARRRREEARRIGTRIAELRENHHLTQQAAAERIRVAYRTYQTWEAGDATPRWHNFQRIAKAYGVTVDDILGNSPPTPSSSQLDRIEREVSEIRGLLRGDDQDAQAVAGLAARLLQAAGLPPPQADDQPESPPEGEQRKSS